MGSSQERLFALLCCLDGAPGLTLGLLQQHVPDQLDSPRDDRIVPWIDDLLNLEARGLIEVTASGIAVLGDPEAGLHDKEVTIGAIGVALELLTSLLPEKSWLPSTWPAYQQFGPVALALIMRCEALGMNDPLEAELALRSAAYQHARCYYDTAEQAAFAALKITSAAARAEPDDARALERVVRAYGHLGRILDAIGDYDTAAKMHAAAVDLARRVYAGRPLRLAGTLLYQARTLRDLGDFQEAIDVVAEAAELLEASSRPADETPAPGGADVVDPRADEEVLRLRITQGRLLLDLGRVQEGKTLLRQLRLADHEAPRRFVGDEALQFDQARILTAQGQMERDLGLYAEASEHLEGALRLNRLHFGEDHVVVAKTLDQLARVHRDQGRYEAARTEYATSADIKAKHLPEGHPERARTQIALAGVMRRLGDLTPAVELAEAALAMFERRVEGHPEVIQALTTRAAIARDAGDFATAWTVLARAERLCGELFPPLAPADQLSHPMVAVVYVTMASLERADGRLAAALRHADAAVEIDAAHYEEGHAETARPLVERGRVLRRLGELHRADEDLLAAEHILVWNFQGLHPEIARLKGHRARVLRSLDERLAVERALHELERARLLARSLPGAGQVDLAALTAEYGRAVLAQGQPDQAVALLSEALTTQEAAPAPADHSLEVAITLASLGDAYAALGAEGDCRAAKERSLAIKRRVFGTRHHQVVRTLRDYGRALQRLHPTPSPAARDEVLVLLTDALAIAVEVDEEGLEGLLPAAQSLGQALFAYEEGGVDLAAGVSSDLRRRVADGLAEGLARVEATFTDEVALSPGNPRVVAATALLDRLRPA